MPRALPAKLCFVMGKGGVGKTTLSAALALAHAQSGQRVGLASLASLSELDATLQKGWGAPPPNLRREELQPRRILEGAMGKLVRMPALIHIITAHPAFDAVYRIAPGVKELALLHGLLEWSATDLDLIVVDALATGHGTHFLEAPRKGAKLLSGKLADRARAIDGVLTDRAQASVMLATTLEEMPVRETVQFAGWLASNGFPSQAVIANRAPERLFTSQQAVDAVERLTDRDTASKLGSEVGASWGMVRRMARAALHMDQRAAEAEPLFEDLGKLGLPLVKVPELPVDDGRLRFIAAKFQEAGL